MYQGKWIKTENGWRHRTWWKVIFNPILRFLQPFSKYKWVFYTFASFEGEEIPKILGYGFGKIEHN